MTRAASRRSSAIVASSAAAGLAVSPPAGSISGLIEWTSGANDGGRAEIARHAKEGGAVRIDLFEAPVRPIGAGRRLHHPRRLRQAASRPARRSSPMPSTSAASRAMPGDDVVVRYPNRATPTAASRSAAGYMDDRADGRRMAPADPARVIAIARAWLGTPYRHQASALRRRLRLPRARPRRLARAAWRRAGRDPALYPRLGRGRRARGSRRGRPRLPDRDRGRRGRPGRADPVPHAPRRAGEALRHPDRGGPAPTFIHAYEGAGVVIHPYSATWARRARFAFLFPG